MPKVLFEEFDYLKDKSKDEITHYKILVQQMDKEYIKGFKLDLLTEEEAKDLISIYEKFLADIDKYYKAFRMFKRENIIKEYK